MKNDTTSAISDIKAKYALKLEGNIPVKSSLPESLRRDLNFMRYAVTREGGLYRYAAKGLKKDWKLASLAILHMFPQDYCHLDSGLMNDVNFLRYFLDFFNNREWGEHVQDDSDERIIKCGYICQTFFAQVGDDPRKNSGFLLKVLEIRRLHAHPSFYQEFFRDKHFAFDMTFRNIGEEIANRFDISCFMNDEALAWKFVTGYRNVYEILPEEHRSKPKFVFGAKTAPRVHELPALLRADPEVVEYCIAHADYPYDYDFSCLPVSILNNRELMRKAANRFPAIYPHLTVLNDDEEICKSVLEKAVTQMFDHFPEHYRASKKWVLEACLNHSEACFRYASDELRHDEDFILHLYDHGVDVENFLPTKLSKEIGKNNPEDYLRKKALFKEVAEACPTKEEVTAKRLKI